MEERIKKITKEKCEEWAKNPTKNPLPGGKEITKNGPVYKKLAERCARFGIVPKDTDTDRDSDSDTGKDINKKTFPNKIGDYVFPKSKETWNGSQVQSEIEKVFNGMKEISAIPDDFFKDLKDLVKICKLALSVDYLIPDDKREYINEFVNYSENIIDNNITVSIDFQNNSLRSLIIDAKYVIRILSVYGNIPDRTLANENYKTINNRVKYYKFYEKYDNLKGYKLHLTKVSRAIAYDNSEESLQLLNKLYQQIQEMIEHFSKLSNVKNNSDSLETISNSKSRSLPASISIRKNITRLLKPKKLVEVEEEYRNPRTREIELVKKMKPDPNEPDEFIERIFESEPDTGRSKFNSHRKLSNVSDFKYPEANEFTKLTPKKRTQILQELRATCSYMKDSITGKRFDRMNKKNLQLIIKIGKNPGQQRCYYARNIYKLWQKNNKENVPFVDPETKQKITQEEKADIMKKIRYINPKLMNPELKSNLKVDPYLKLIIEQSNLYPNFYTIQTKYIINNNSYVSLIQDLGSMPANLEIDDVNGSANMTSSAIAASLQELFEKGRLMVSNFAPFVCCRMHLSKSLEYWTTPANDKPLIKGINIERWNKFAEEIYSLL